MQSPISKAFYTGYTIFYCDIIYHSWKRTKVLLILSCTDSDLLQVLSPWSQDLLMTLNSSSHMLDELVLATNLSTTNQSLCSKISPLSKILTCFVFIFGLFSIFALWSWWKLALQMFKCMYVIIKSYFIESEWDMPHPKNASYLGLHSFCVVHGGETWIQHRIFQVCLGNQAERGTLQLSHALSPEKLAQMTMEQTLRHTEAIRNNGRKGKAINRRSE